VEEGGRRRHVHLRAHPALPVNSRAAAERRRDLDPEVVQRVLSGRTATRDDLKAILTRAQAGSQLPPRVVIWTRGAVGRAGAGVSAVVPVATVVRSLIHIVHV